MRDLLVICTEMKKRYLITILFVYLLGNLTFAQNDTDLLSSQMKITLRDVANKLLVTQGDSTSLILPVKEVADNRFRISFEKEIQFEPTLLVDIIKSSFQKAGIQRDYLVEVKQCEDEEVAYSYSISFEAEKTIVPCLDRQLPAQCYHIEVLFLNEDVAFFDQKTLLIIVVLTLVFALIYFFLRQRTSSDASTVSQEEFTIIGGFLFYKDQNILIKQHDEIVLSKKECELLEIFSENINTVVKREELTKKVWEDKGVIVGRSLDTYISKLRKKLQSDTSIRIINIHGVGYKLEVTESES